MTVRVYGCARADVGRELNGDGFGDHGGRIRQPAEGPGKKQFHILLFFWPVTGVTSADTYEGMRRQMCLGDKPKSGAIFVELFITATLNPVGGYGPGKSPDHFSDRALGFKPPLMPSVDGLPSRAR